MLVKQFTKKKWLFRGSAGSQAKEEEASCGSGGFDDMEVTYYMSEKSSTDNTSGRLASLPSFGDSTRSVTLGSQDSWSSASTSQSSISWTMGSLPLSPQAASTPREQPPRPSDPVAKQLLMLPGKK